LIILWSDRAPEDQETVGIDPLRNRLTLIRATDLEYDTVSGQPLANPTRASRRLMLYHEHSGERFIGLPMVDPPHTNNAIPFRGLCEVIDHCASLVPRRRGTAASESDLRE